MEKQITLKINEPGVSANLTHLQGDVVIPYEDLIERLGPPRPGADKTNVIWILELNGVVATIYDYRNSQGPEYNRHWHIGGHDQRAVDVVRVALPGYQTDKR